MTTGVSSVTARIASVDLVRVIALLAIVWGHTFPSTELSDQLVQSWRLPVFFMLTGYFWSGSRPLRQEAEKRFRTLLVPYAFWLVIILVIGLPKVTSFDLVAMVRMVGGAVLGGDYAKRPFTTFWFFTALFAAVVSYRFLQRYSNVVRLTIVAVGLAANLIAGPELARVPLAVATAAGALIFLEAGRVVRQVQPLLAPWARAAAAAGCTALAVLLLALADDFAPLDMKSGQFSADAVVVALGLGAALLLAATAWTRMPWRLARAVNIIAKPSLVVIILHPLVLVFLSPETTDIPLIAVFVVAFLVPLVLGQLLMRTTLAPVLVGVDQHGQEAFGDLDAEPVGVGRLAAARRWLVRPIGR